MKLFHNGGSFQRVFAYQTHLPHTLGNDWHEVQASIEFLFYELTTGGLPPTSSTQTPQSNASSSFKPSKAFRSHLILTSFNMLSTFDKAFTRRGMPYKGRPHVILPFPLVRHPASIQDNCILKLLASFFPD